MGLMRALGGIGSRGTLSGVCGNVCGRVGWGRYWCGRTARMQISVGFMCSAPDVVVGQDGLGFCGRGFWGACADVGSQWPAEPFRCNDGLGRFRRIASRAPRGVAIVISNPVVKKAKAKVFTASIRELLDQSSKVVRSKKRNPNTAVAKLAAKGLFGRSVPRVNPASAHKGTQAKSSSITMTG